MVDTVLPRVMVPIVRGHMARLLIYSGVIDRLLEIGAYVIILTDTASKKYIEARYSSPNVIVDVIHLPRRRIADRWYRVYNYLFHTFLPTSTSRIRLDWIKQNEPRRYRIIRAMSPQMTRRVRQWWIRVRHLLLPEMLVKSYFDKHQPDVVVVGSAARNLEEYYLLRYAIKHGVRNICTLQSWDLLTTKGDLLERPDKMTVWNSANQREAVSLFQYSSENVVVVGAPQFDIYFKPETYLNREDWCRCYDLDPTKKVIFITGGSGIVHENLPNVIRAVIDGIERHIITKEIQILIRPHPAVYFGTVPGKGTEQDLLEYESWHSAIRCNRPRPSGLKVIADTAPEEHTILANNLYHADVLIDFYGTVSVEACLVGTPVIYADVRSTFSDAGDQVHNVIDRNDFTHLRQIIETEGVRVVFNRIQLYQWLNTYLQQPYTDAEGRQAIAGLFGYSQQQGYSVDRMAQVIYEYGKWNKRKND